MILTIYTAFCLPGSLPTWSHRITLYTRLAFPTRPLSRRLSNKNPLRVTSARSTARECASSCPVILHHVFSPWCLGGGPAQGWPDFSKHLPLCPWREWDLQPLLPANVGDAGDSGSIPGLRKFHGGENGNPVQYSCLGNPTDREAWWATVHRVTKSWTRLSAHAPTIPDHPRDTG